MMQNTSHSKGTSVLPRMFSRIERASVIKFTVILLVFGLVASVGPSVASATEDLPIEDLCDELGLLGCDGSVDLNTPGTSGWSLGPTGLNLAASGSGGLAGGLAFEGPRGGPGGLALIWDGSGDGQVGVGFSLSGAPTVSRCAPTPLLNGVFGAGVDYQAAIGDATWCLNGSQLEDVSGDGSEYRTKVESGVIVRREGGSSWGDPDAHFVAYGRSGTVTTFDQRLGDDVVFSFLPSSVRDASSNTINYVWERDVGAELATGFWWIDYRLAAVSWGGNALAGASDEFVAELEYEVRPHPIEQFAAGLKFVTGHRLVSVTVGRGASQSDADYEPIRQYQLGYVASSDYDPRSYLSSVQRCEERSSSTLEWSRCTDPSTIEWDNINTDAEAFDANPAAARTETALGDGWLDSPYEIGGVGPLRHFEMGSTGELAFSWRTDAVSPFPTISVAGKVGDSLPSPDQSRLVFGEEEFIETYDFDADIDVHRFVTDRDYFYSKTRCSNAGPYNESGGSGTLRVCGVGVELSGNTCTNNGQSFTYSANDAAGWTEGLRDQCFDEFNSYVKNRVFKKVSTAFGPQMAALVSGARLYGDFNCDGLQEWVEPNMSGGPSMTWAGATGPTMYATYDIPSGWDISNAVLPSKRFYQEFGAYIRAMSDAYSGLVVADFNGDCYADIYQMYGADDAKDRLYIGDGSGGFAFTEGPTTFLQEREAGWITTDAEEIKKMRVRASDKTRLRFGHFNNDGLLDVMYINGWMGNFNAPADNRSPVNTHLNNGDGTWTTHYDGPELVVRAPLNGSSNSTPNALALTNRDIASIQIAHMNDDGCHDLFVLPRPTEKDATSGWDSFARIYYSHCDGTHDLRHSQTENLPVSLLFQGHRRDDGRALGGFQIVQDENGTSTPDEIQLLWLHDVARTASVRLGDLNGDGRSDIYVVREDGRDFVWLNMGDNQFVHMWGLDEGPIGEHPVNKFGNVPSEVTWDIDSQLEFDISRYSLTSTATGELPGMWVGGELFIDERLADWGPYEQFRVAPERFYESNFEQVRVRSISDGIGNTTTFEWDIHREPGNPQATMPVVTAAETTVPGTAGGNGVWEVDHRTEYTYTGLVVDRFGSRGWASVSIEQMAPAGDGRRKIETTYWQDERRTAGTPKEIREYVLSNGGWVKVAERTNRLAVDWLDDPGFGPRDSLAYRNVPDVDCAAGWGVSRTWRLDGTLSSESCKTGSSPDIWGNLDWTLTTHLDGSSVEVRHTFDGTNSGTDEATMRYRGLASAEDTAITSWDGQTQTTTQWTAWNLTHFEPKAVTIPGQDGKNAYVHYTYNTRGTVTTKKSGGSDINEVIETYSFIDGTVPSTVSKEIGGVTHKSETVFADRTLETPTSVIDVNGVRLDSVYDAAGRLIQTSGDGTDTVRYFYRTDPTSVEQAVLGGAWSDWRVPEAGPAEYTVYDRTGRVVRTAIATPIGWSVVDTYYDYRGANSETSLPFIAQGAQLDARDHLDTVDAYDALGRPTQATTAAGNIVETTYDTSLPPGTSFGPYYANYPQALITTTATTVDGVTSWTSVDAAGKTIAGTNTLKHQWFSRYDPSGNLIAHLDPEGNESLWIHDDWGRVTSSIDPDFGTTEMGYDAAGNVTSTQDNLGNRTEIAYDDLGRLLTSNIYDEFGVLWDSSTFTYDTKPNGIGLLATQTSNHESVDYTYTTLGQLEAVTRSITAGGQTHITTSIAFYDPLGRNYRTQIDDRFFQNTYDPNTGEVIALFDSDSGDIYWEAAGYDSFGRLALEGRGNGTAQRVIAEDATDLTTDIDTYSPDGTIARSYDFTWDQRGNLTSRSWLNAKGNEHSEVFSYDSLDRLATSRVDGLDMVTRTYTPTNHLLSKSDYLDGELYLYAQGGGAGPSTPSRIGDRRFHYNANGNLIAEKLWVPTKNVVKKTPVDKEPVERGERGGILSPTDPPDTFESGALIPVSDNTWTPHNRLETSTRWDTSGNRLVHVEQSYGVEGSKIYQAIVDDETDTTKSTWYLSSNLRLVDEDGELTRQLDVTGPSGTIATISIDEASGLDSILHRHSDHLGSPVHYTDATGTVIADLAYGPDGSARNIDDWSTLEVGDTDDNPHEDGFGGHDALARFGLTDLGARIYDQHRGQFIQPDTYGDQLRYSYGNNNPLSSVDPDGHYAQVLHFLGSFAINSASNMLGGPSVTSNLGFDGSAETIGIGSGAAQAQRTINQADAGITAAQNAFSWRGVAEFAFETAAYGALLLAAGPLGLLGETIAGALAEALTIYVFDTLIDGKDFVETLSHKHTLSGVVDLLLGKPFVEVITDPEDLTNLALGLVPGPAIAAATPLLREAAPAMAKAMDDLLKQGRELGQKLSDGVSSARKYVSELIWGKKKANGGPGNGPKADIDSPEAQAVRAGKTTKSHLPRPDSEFTTRVTVGDAATEFEITHPGTGSRLKGYIWKDSNGNFSLDIEDIKVPTDFQQQGYGTGLYNMAAKLMPQGKSFEVLGFPGGTNKELIDAGKNPARYSQLNSLSSVLGGTWTHDKAVIGWDGMRSYFTPNKIIPRHRPDRSKRPSTPRPAVRTRAPQKTEWPGRSAHLGEGREESVVLVG